MKNFATGPISYFDTARLIAGDIGADEALIEGVNGAEFGLPLGGTPANTTLDSSWMAERFGIVVPPAADVIRGSLPARA